jgi:hypothetical protein
VSNTGGHGRGGQSGRIIGDVINHGKHKFWGQQNVHYHQGMVAGENTLNAVCARLVTRGITAEKGSSSSRFLADYVSFMTTPGSHNDTYAESFHRDFFSNWAAGVPPERCAGKEGHNTPTIGGFVMLPPVVFANAWRGEALMKRAVVEHLRLTHDSEMLAQRAEVYAGLLADLARGKPLREAAAAAGKAIGVDVTALAKDAAGNDAAVVGRRFSTACYITDRRAHAGSAAALLRASADVCACALPHHTQQLSVRAVPRYGARGQLRGRRAVQHQPGRRELPPRQRARRNHGRRRWRVRHPRALHRRRVPCCCYGCMRMCAHSKCACTALTHAPACVRRPGGFQGDQERD